LLSRKTDGRRANSATQASGHAEKMFLSHEKYLFANIEVGLWAHWWLTAPGTRPKGTPTKTN
jgi:hypothetical protein